MLNYLQLLIVIINYLFRY